jgi:hypothetical protein
VLCWWFSHAQAEKAYLSEPADCRRYSRYGPCLRNSRIAEKPESGRLWDILQDASTDPDLKKALDLSSIRFLVIDEADRMVSHGHYQELDKILGRIYKQAKAFQTVLLSATMTSTCTRSKPKTARST